MNFDLGADTFEGKRISQKSRSIAKEIVGDDSLEDKIRQRVVIATGDPNFKDLLVFSHDPIERGIKAINEGRSLFTDINMVKVGISKKVHKCSIHCVLDCRPLPKGQLGCIEDASISESPNLMRG